MIESEKLQLAFERLTSAVQRLAVAVERSNSRDLEKPTRLKAWPEMRLTSEQTEILAFVAECGGAARTGEIWQGTYLANLSDSSMNKALHRVITGGFLERKARGIYALTERGVEAVSRCQS